MKLILGTVQFGLDYGITNTAGRTPRVEVARILDVAREAGVAALDTAAGYGDAEEILGALEAGTRFPIISKTRPLPSDDDEGVNAVVNGVRASLKMLGVPRLHALLVHKASDLEGTSGPALYTALSDMRQAGLCERIGVSVYDPAEAIALAQRYRLDIVQVPFSALDQRLVSSSAASRLQDLRVEVHVRSIFLQGALLDPEGTARRGLSRLAGPLAAFTGFASRFDLSPMEAAVGFVRTQAVDGVVVGATTAAELTAIAAAWTSHRNVQQLPWAEVAVQQADLIDPRRWTS